MTSIYSQGAVNDLLADKLSDAPIDGSTYGRKDGAWAVPPVGDRYLTSSTTSNTISNGNKTFTIGTGLSYTPTQNVTISFDASNHMHGEVLTYDSGTGVMTVDIKNHTGSGTYTSWVVNVGGVTPATSVAWGDITGTLSSQTDLQSELDLKLVKASNLSDLTNAGTARTNLGLGGLAVLNDAPSDGSQYARQSGAWAVVTGGGGGSGGVDIQTFSTAGTFTWTKPAGAKWVVGYMFGAGGGGGSGAKNATTAIRSGGAGGAGGGMLRFSIDASLLSATESVVIGAGGLGGASRTTDSTAGIAGSQGGMTSFAGRYRAYYAIAGAAGSLTGVAGGAGGSAAGYDGVCFQVSAVNPGGNGNAGAGGNASFNYVGYYAPSGGGGGAGQAASVIVARVGGAGGTKTAASGSGQVGMVATIAGGAGGTVAGVSPTNGAAGSIAYGGGTGGGGGAYLTGVAGMAGANGGTFGGGGGGGSAADNGTAGSGAGGNGGDGALILITYLG